MPELPEVEVTRRQIAPLLVGRRIARVVTTGDSYFFLSFSPAMRHLQFWSQPGRDFICLEPFYGPNDTVNTDRRLDVPARPGAGLLDADRGRPR